MRETSIGNILNSALRLPTLTNILTNIHKKLLRDPSRNGKRTEEKGMRYCIIALISRSSVVTGSAFVGGPATRSPDENQKSRRRFFLSFPDSRRAANHRLRNYWLRGRKASAGLSHSLRPIGYLRLINTAR